MGKLFMPNLIKRPARPSSITIYLPIELNDRFLIKCEQYKMSKTAMVEQMIRHCLDDMDETENKD